jgi:hypothetical protein
VRPGTPVFDFEEPDEPEEPVDDFELLPQAATPIATAARPGMSSFGRINNSLL